MHGGHRPRDVSARATSWNWTADEPLLGDLKDALNRIIHAQVLKVGFETLPENVTVIDGDAVVIPYEMVETDHKKLSFVDPFSIAHAFLYGPAATQPSS